MNNPEDTLMEIKANVPELVLIENDYRTYKCPKCQSEDVTIKRIPVEYISDNLNTS